MNGAASAIVENAQVGASKLLWSNRRSGQRRNWLLVARLVGVPGAFAAGGIDGGD